MNPCNRHAWLVTAPSRQWNTVPPAPWGTYHLKPNGGLLTACGEYAVGWAVFWGRPINAADPEACRACMRVASGQVGAHFLTTNNRR